MPVPCTRQLVDLGSDPARHATKRLAPLHDTQAEAIAVARQQAQREGAELIIKGEDGRIRACDSHGRDGCPAAGLRTWARCG
jgi:hypothetical protein